MYKIIDHAVGNKRKEEL